MHIPSGTSFEPFSMEFRELPTKYALTSSKITANWTMQQKEILLDLILDEKREGTIGIDNSIKKPVWTRLETQFAIRTHWSYGRQQLQTALHNMKKKYEAFMAVKANSGWGWDHERNIPTAEDDVWAAYVKAHPEAKEFRFQTLPLLDKLDELFSGTVVSGEHAKGTARKPKQQYQPPTRAILSNSCNSKDVFDVDLIPSSGETKDETEDFSPLPPSDLNMELPTSEKVVKSPLKVFNPPEKTSKLLSRKKDSHNEQMMSFAATIASAMQKLSSTPQKVEGGGRDPEVVRAKEKFKNWRQNFELSAKESMHIQR